MRLREKHGMHQSREYQTWEAMIQRCTNPNAPKYENYGGRGITIHPLWRSFKNFYSDMGERPAGTSIDRIDTNKGYHPDNCRWADQKTQTRNRRLCSRNTSGVKGVGWFKRDNKWRARLCLNDVDKHLGYFDKFEDAVAARKEAEAQYWRSVDVANK